VFQRETQEKFSVAKAANEKELDSALKMKRVLFKAQKQKSI
jgi:hypothetical protein